MKKAQPSEKFPSDIVGVPLILEANPDGITADELKSLIEASPKPVIETVYDPTQEIVDRLDRIAKAIEESNVLARAELRVKGIEP